MTHAAELRAAAARIRGRAEKTTPGPWEATDNRSVRGADGENIVASVAARRLWPSTIDAAHIAAWSPGPALAVAAWLEQTAERHGDDDGGQHRALCHSGHWDNDSRPGFRTWVPDPCPDMVAAMAVALAIPGGES